MSRIDDLLTPAGIAVLRQLNPGFSGRMTGNNCPATAAALAHYLETGEVVPAQSITTGQGFVQTDSGRFIVTPLAGIVRQLGNRLQHGSYRVVYAEAGERHHEFVLVNIQGIVHYADAQPVPPVVSRELTGPHGYISWARVFQCHRGPGYAVRRVSAA